jgi:autotransporter-associated beta strand protein
VFNKSGSPASLISNQGNHGISASVQLASDMSAAVNAGTLTISGAVFGNGDLTKSGAGTLALTAANSHTGDTVVQAGTLRVYQPSFVDTADLYLSTGAFINLNFTSGPDIIDSFFIDGVSQSAGIWGAVGSDAPFSSEWITGAGRLQVTTFIPPPLAGDFNADGIVDAADYVVWRHNMNSTEADYEAWRTNFGRMAASGTSAATVPEPGSLILVLLTAHYIRRRSPASATSKRASRSPRPPGSARNRSAPCR